ncbi:response regulator [Marinobacter halodurans]|uniref:histidine kinase n=1 Tax=Marinobacter halodurans TaxID=2528979 RepID=A0ABY1ZFS2_9GAMM|nr:response regulator [Marinobacter halodurans]TBW49848.1 response regulator [Marinobacter halodurans]
MIIVALALLAPHAAVAAQPACHEVPVQVAPGQDQVNLASCLWYLEDPGAELSLEEVRQRDQAGDFRKHDGGILNFGYTESAYWARFDLNYTGDMPVERILELSLPLVDHVAVHIYRDGTLADERGLGYTADWADRELLVPNPVFKLALHPDEKVRVYLRVKTANTFRLPLTLWSPDAYVEKVAVDETIQGIFLGSILAILAYNLFVAVSVRERSNVYYVLYLVFATLFIATEQVHGLQLFDHRPWFLNKDLLHYQILLTWFFGIQMARELLELPQRAPELDTTMRVCLGGVVLTFFLSLFMPYHIAMEWTVIGSISLSIVMILVSYWAWRHFNPAARTYFFAWTCTLAGVGLYALTVMGYFPLNYITGHSPQIGLTAQVILFSFALADRIKLIQAEALDWSRRALSNLTRYQSLFNNAVEGIFQMSLERRFLAANPAMAELLGYDDADSMMREVPDVLSACFADPGQRQQVIERLAVSGGAKGMETRCFTPQGEERWLNVSLNTVYDADGEPVHLEGTCIDITERMQREAIEKERENERMEKELARNAAEAKSQFLANMSHEIRTPLAAIIGYGENLLDPELDGEEKRNSAETVVRSGRHLLDLVNDILDHSKIDANKLNVEILTVDLPELLDEVRAFFVPRAREKGIDFSIHCDFPLPEQIRTDPTRFRQIIINLCGNALKFTENGTISLSIRCQRDTETLVAKVVDSGIGMKPEQLQRLFDPFAQGSAAIARQYGGTGLGLSISRRLAELLGGSIAVNSVYGEGSEFEVTIATGPLEGVHLLRDASELTQRRRLLPMVTAPRLRGRILCAEDNEVNRKLVALMVERTGAEIVHVSNGAEALDAATHGAFDLILMDIQMPVMNGRDATAALREAGVNTPIVALTANVMAEDIEDYRRAGCTDHLAKPIDKRRFYEVLARYLTLDDWPTQAEEQQYEGTVLVAEDNDDNRRLVERLLGRFGLDVIAVTSGRQAVQTALSRTVHLVLMDRHMPDMDGPAATRMLRQTGFRRPIIAFTAGDQREIEELVDAGCDGVLNKPIDQGHLAATLARYLSASGTTLAASRESDGIRALVEQFRTGLPERIRTLETALADADWPALQRQVHQIKGTAGAMGYPRMTEQAGVVEGAIRRGDTGQAIDQSDTLINLMRQAVANQPHVSEPTEDR